MPSQSGVIGFSTQTLHYALHPHPQGMLGVSYTGARVLTSSENLAQMNEKVRKKEETAKETARKKEEREQKRIEQQEQ